MRDLGSYLFSPRGILGVIDPVAIPRRPMDLESQKDVDGSCESWILLGHVVGGSCESCILNNNNATVS